MKKQKQKYTRKYITKPNKQMKLFQIQPKKDLNQLSFYNH